MQCSPRYLRVAIELLRNLQRSWTSWYTGFHKRHDNIVPIRKCYFSDGVDVVRIVDMTCHLGEQILKIKTDRLCDMKVDELGAHEVVDESLLVAGLKLPVVCSLIGEPRWIHCNKLKTEIVMTCNLREWRHFFKVRCPKAAHPQMREISIELLGKMKKAIPVVFDDLVF